MNPQTRKYHIILVHRADQEATHQALRSLSECVQPPDQIIVIDHGQRPLDNASVPSVLIRPPRNTGYAGGVNYGLGVLLSRGVKGDDIVVIMNNDVVVRPDAFQELRRWWAGRREVALMGAIIEEPGGTVRRSYVNLLTGRTHLFGPAPPCAVPYTHGAFFAAPYTLFMQTRGLPEEYFIYWEDAALSRRVQALGIPQRTAGRVRVAHRARAAAPTTTQLYYLVRNGALFLERETPRRWRPYWWIVNRLRLLYHTFNPKSHPLVQQALRDAAGRRTGPRLP